MDTLPIAPTEAPDGTITEDVVKAGIQRDKPQIDDSRSALVKQWSQRISKAKSHFKKDFDRMREDQKFVRGAQWDGKESDDLYTANVIQRHIGQRVAALYAKNPKVVVRKRQTLDFQQWDGTTDSLQSIQMALDLSMQSGVPMPPETLALISDISQGVQRRMMLDKVSKTLQIIYDYTLNQQIPPFKIQMKQLVRRTCATGVGFIKLGFQRVFERDPSDVERINGLTEQVSILERILSDQADGELSQSAAELEQLRLMLSDYEGRDKQIAREGLVFDFPTSTSVIIDPACRHLRTFTGARWIAEEHILTVDDVKEIYGIDLSSAGTATKYDTENAGGLPNLRDHIANVTDGETKKKDGICVWTVWDKTASQTLTIADGYEDFLIEPKAPDVFLERFWPIFPLTFNECEDEESIYPRSDVHLLKPMQREYNRCREGLRQHRIANRPKTAVAAGQLSEDDISKLENHPANAVIMLQALPPNGDVAKLLQPIKGPPIDQALYDTNPIFEDLLRVVGQSDASIGMASGDTTATGDSIAEQNRSISMASNVDDLDDVLNELSRAAGQILLAELSPETARKIAGVGAVWPELSNQEIADELLLEIEAGSSGRPNRAAEIANVERLAPLLMQMPGIKPDWMVRQLITRMDDRLDPTDAIAAGLPSILAQNAMSKAAPMVGGPNAPDAQGAQGADNKEKAPETQPSGPPSSLPQQGPGGIVGG